MISAVTLAVAPTVSLRSSSWISPSTEPSISRSSLPEISPLTCRLGPRRAVARSEVAPIGRNASVLMVLVPSQVAAEDFGGGFTGKFFNSGCAGSWVCCGASGFLFHIGPPKGYHPTRIPPRGRKTISLREARRKQSIGRHCLKVTRLMDRVANSTKTGAKRRRKYLTGFSYELGLSGTG